MIPHSAGFRPEPSGVESVVEVEKAEHDVRDAAPLDAPDPDEYGDLPDLTRDGYSWDPS